MQTRTCRQCTYFGITKAYPIDTLVKYPNHFLCVPHNDALVAAEERLGIAKQFRKKPLFIPKRTVSGV